MIDIAVLRAMASSGATVEVILAAVEAAQAVELKKLQEKRAKDAERKRRSRAVTRTDADSTGQRVTPCDAADADMGPPCSPPSMVSPNTPSLTPPSQSPSSSESARARGTRLTDDWQPSDGDLRWAGEQDLRLFEIDYETEKFRDWAKSANGPNAVKRDWRAAWRNWMRKAIENRRGKNGNISKLTTQEAALELAKRLGQVPAGNGGAAGGPVVRLLSAK